MPIKFIVVNTKLPFRLGMSFLKLAGIQIDCATKKVIMQLADNRIIKLQSHQNVPEKCLSNAVLNALKGFAEVASQDVYVRSEKQAKHMLCKPNIKAFIALVHTRTLKQQEEVQNIPVQPRELAKNKSKFAIKFVEANYKNCDKLVSNAINTTTK